MYKRKKFKFIISTVAAVNNRGSLSSETTYSYKIRAYRMVGTTKVYGDFTTVISAKA